MTDHLPQRKRSLRLGGWNYACSEWYFVTVCTHEKHVLFGDIRDGCMYLNDIGNLVRKQWMSLPAFNPGIILDAFIIMPNHLHGLLHLPRSTVPPPVGSRLSRDRSHADGLSAVIGRFKAFSSRAINARFGMPGDSIWQRNYHDHVVRSTDDLERIRKYIRHNPSTWERDAEYRE